MDAILRRIFVPAVALSLMCFIGSVFAQTPVPESVSKVLRGETRIVNTIPPVISDSVFRRGHVFAAVGSGKVQHYDENGNLLGTLITSPVGGFTTGMATDTAGNLYVTNFSEDFVSKFTGPGVPHIHSVAFTTDPNSSVESILFDKEGNIYVGQADSTKDILKYDAAGNLLMRYDVAVEERGSDWIDLDPDQQTMYYTSEGSTVKRFDVVNNVQLSDFATGLPGTYAFALRVLPVAIGGGMLVADTETILRLDDNGNIIQTYDAPGEDGWFALNLDPDRSSFWSADFGTDNFYKFDIASGDILLGPINTGTGIVSLFGLAVFGEIAGGQNNQPMVEAIPPGPFFINQGDLLSFDVKASDVDPGDTLTLDVIDLPPGAVMTPALPAVGIDSVISTFSWTPMKNAYTLQPGVYDVIFTVKDAGGLTDSVLVQINVNATPNCSIDPPGPFTVFVDQPLNFDALASDADLNDVITLSVTDLPTGATMTPSLPLTGAATGISSAFNWTPVAGQEDSTYVVQYMVTDTKDTSFCSASITVKLNNPPVCEIVPAGPFVITELDTLSFDVLASDPDGGSVGNELTLEVLGVLPSGATMTPVLPLIGPGTGISSAFEWVPAIGQAGLYTVEYMVTDPLGVSDTCSTQISVKGFEFPPVCEVIPPGPFSVFPGELVTFDVSATDQNPDDIITLDVTGLPPGSVMNPSLPLTGAGTGIMSNFTWTPTFLDIGNYLVTYTVADTSGFQDTCTVEITVNAPVNEPPVCQVDPPGPFNIIAGNLLNFTVSATDPDTNDVITLSVSGLPTGAVMTPTLPLTGAGSGISSLFSWTPANADFGNYIVTYVVVDSLGLSDTCTVDITVDTLVNNPPVCDITPATSFNIFVGEFLTFDVTATDPDPGDILTLGLFPGDVLPSGATMNPPLPTVGPGPVFSTFGWTPVAGQEDIYIFGYQITDSLGAQTFCKVDITVNPDTIPPLCELTNIDPGPPFTIEVTVQDGESGIAAINIVTANNAIVTIPPFTPGTNDPIIVTAEKINQNQGATVVLKAVDGAGNTTLCDPVYQTISATIPDGFALKQNFPNPFNPATTIYFDVAAGNGGAVDVSLRIYDVTGREVKTLVHEAMQPGKYSVEWDATNNHGNAVAGGIYIYRMVAGDFVATRKMVLLK